jgi:ElaB/YqjD/DUF883 family membrane-anchored ribosome-binding protein
MSMSNHATTQRLKDDLAAVLRDAELLMQASAEYGGEKTAAARARIRESLDAAKRRLHEAEQSAVRHGEEAVHATEDYTRKNPWQALGIAAGIGLVIGVLVARR